MPKYRMSIFSFFRRRKTRSNNNDSITAAFLSNLSTTQSGVHVTAETAMQVAAANACIRVISEDIASASFHVFKRGPKGRQRDDGHYVYRLIHDRPNEDMTPIDFWQLAVANVCIYGNSYNYIVKQNERASDLLPLNPQCTKAKRINGVIIYETKVNGERVTLKQDQVLHFKNMTVGGDYLNGKSVIEQASEVLGVAQAADSYSARYFGDGTHLNGYLKQSVAAKKDAEETLLRTWKEQYSSIGNAHKTPLLPFGFDFVQTTLNPEQTQLLDSKMFSAVQICGLFRVQPPKIGILEKSSFNTLEQVEISHVRSTLSPYARRIEQEVNRKLFLEIEKATYYAEFDLDSLMRGDRASQDKSWATGIQWGWYSANDVRRQQNLPEIEGGDEYLSPLNMQPKSGADSQAQEEPQPQQQNINNQNAKVQTAFTRDIAKRIATKVGKALERQATKEKDLAPWLINYLRDKEQQFRDTLAPALEPWQVDQVIRSMRDKLPSDLDDATAFDALPQYIEQLPEVIVGLMETNE